MNTSTARRQDVALLALRLQRRGIRPTVAELKAKEAIESAGIDFGRVSTFLSEKVPSHNASCCASSSFYKEPLSSSFVCFF